MKEDLKYLQLSREELVSKLLEEQQKCDFFKDAFEKGLEEKENEKLILEKLIHASDEFIQFHEETPDYDSLLQTVMDISGAKYAVLNIFDDNGLEFNTVAIGGIQENIKNGLSLLGFNVINKHWKHDPDRAEKTKHQNITKFKHLRDLTGDIVSKNVIHLIEKTFGIGETFVVKIAKEDKVLGDFTLLYLKGETISNDKFVDLYVHQVGMFLDQQKNKSLLREHEARHRAMILNISDVITIIDSDGILTYRSPNCEKWFGWKANDLVGTSGWATVHPDDLVRIQKDFYLLLQENRSVKTVEYRYKCKDGTYKLIELTAINLVNDPVIHGVLLNYHDITERKNVENLVFKTNLLLKAILESSPEVIVFALDKQYRYLAFNSKHKSAIQQIWGKEIEIGMSMLEVIGDHQDREKAKVNFDRALAGESFVLSEDYGDERLSRLSWLDYWAPIYDDNENVTGLTCFVLNITERKRMEEALQESEAELKMAQRIAHMGSWTLDHATNQVNWTEGLYQMLGLDKNQPPPIYTEHKKLFTAQSWSLLNSALSNTQITGKPYELELEMVRPEGGNGWMLAFGEAVRDAGDRVVGLRGAAQDITRRKQAETELILNKQKLEAIITASPDGIGMISPEGKLQLISDKMATMYGYDVAEIPDLLGKEIFDFIDSSCHKNLNDNIRKLLSGESDHRITEYLGIKKDNSRFYVDVNSTVLLDPVGNPSDILFVERDITESKLADLALNLKNAELQKLNNEKDKFFSIIAHDLRSPFNGFLGLTQIMAEELSDLTMEELQKIAVSMQNSAINLYRLLENLLEWSKVQQGLITNEPGALKLLPLVNECVSTVNESAKGKEIEIELCVNDGIEVFADVNMLQTVIRNLVSNSVKFTPIGGKVTISALNTKANFVEVSITDTGIGMSCEMVENLFRIDVQTNRKGTEGEPSTGLGLLLCKEFIEKQGGTIRVESEVGKGSVFYFTIPKK